MIKYQEFDSRDDHQNENVDPVIKEYIGNLRILFKKNGIPTFTIGPHWAFFVVMFVMLNIIGLSCAFLVAANASLELLIFTFILTLSEAVIYLLTAIKNPGIIIPVLSDIENKMDENLKCENCGAIRNKDSYHCIDCNVCVDGFDHHSVWMGKCIGKGNIIYFDLFGLHTTIFLVYCVFITIQYLGNKYGFINYLFE